VKIRGHPFWPAKIESVEERASKVESTPKVEKRGRKPKPGKIDFHVLFYGEKTFR
jgi:hypothetical protein